MSADRSPWNALDFREVDTVEQLHRVVWNVARDAVVVDIDDVRMGKLSERVVLAYEQQAVARQLTRVARIAALQSDDAVGLTIAHAKHDRRGAASQHAFDVISACDRRAGLLRSVSLHASSIALAKEANECGLLPACSCRFESMLMGHSPIEVHCDPWACRRV
jgi:hypothetical protein